MGVKYLVDTHVVLWLLSNPERIATDVRERLADPANALLVSAATGLEIATKIRTGKLNAPGLVATFPRRLASIGATSVPISLEHGLLAGELAWEHRDPFDRLLVAQATIEDAILVTVDSAILDLPTQRFLTW